ncbi:MULTISPECIES: DUF1281 domain-containing protein [Vibrio]|uniref:Uncharacterized protein n=1 Tax=Vibrio splendidus TaxID=29497 RepID=A0A2N7JR82_VIBSP|nr:DUF1281 domain-containing protein [Vibrio splendidus]PMM53597.1 hypothetical protein BCT54_22865 [Vibrio splendidus]
MPNWCVNKIELSGRSAATVKAYWEQRNEASFRYRKALHQALHLFVAGVGRVLLPTQAVEFSPYPSWVSDEWLALPDCDKAAYYDQFVSLMMSDPRLTNGLCEHINDIYSACQLEKMEWHSLMQEQQASITEFLQTGGFWPCGQLNQEQCSTLWSELGSPATLDETQLDLREIVRPRLWVELGGFNGKGFRDVLSGFDANWHELGTKWEIVTVSVHAMTDEHVNVEFDTAWGPCSEAIEHFANSYELDLTHTYCEAGCDFCGQLTYENGVLVESVSESLELSEEEDDDGCHEVVGPSYILGLSSYGG